MKQLSIVVPCFNEEEVLPKTTSELTKLLARLVANHKISEKSCIYFIDDGSTDNTWSLIESFASASDHVAGIKLSTNFGHQNALLAGLLSVPGDLVLSIDADLQDDLGIVESMIDLNMQNFDVIYGVRKQRPHDSIFKKYTAHLFYAFMHFINPKTIANHADFRLMSRRSVEALRQFPETGIFLRGIIPLIGFNSTIVHYDRLERAAGKTKYPLSKMVSLAWNGISSSSIIPLRLITLLGAVTFLITGFISIYIIVLRLFTDLTIPGWTSTALPIYFFSGVQLISIGILGEYIGKIFTEIKARPKYFIDQRSDEQSDKHTQELLDISSELVDVTSDTCRPKRPN